MRGERRPPQGEARRARQLGARGSRPSCGRGRTPPCLPRTARESRRGRGRAARDRVARRVACGCRRDDSTRFAESDEIAQALELSGEHLPAERRQPVVPPSLVIGLDGWTTPRLVDESVLLEASDGAVEITRLELDTAAGVLEDVLSDA